MPVTHVLGYVGRISEQDEARIDPSNYAGTHHIGKLGLERFYESVLHGQVGYQKVESNALGRIIKVLDGVDAVPGRNIQLHLDLPTQLAALEGLGDRRGAVVALDPSTGGILAFVSTPSYDPNPFVTGIDFASYAALNENPDRPLVNRALQGQYPPGSTIKPLVALAGIE